MIYSYAITTLLQKSHDDNLDVNCLYLHFDYFVCSTQQRCLRRKLCPSLKTTVFM